MRVNYANLQGKKDNSRSLLTEELHIRQEVIILLYLATAGIVGSVVILTHWRNVKSLELTRGIRDLENMI